MMTHSQVYFRIIHEYPCSSSNATTDQNYTENIFAIHNILDFKISSRNFLDPNDHLFLYFTGHHNFNRKVQFRKVLIRLAFL